jgi:hypothetical protein
MNTPNKLFALLTLSMLSTCIMLLAYQIVFVWPLPAPGIYIATQLSAGALIVFGIGGAGTENNRKAGIVFVLVGLLILFVAHAVFTPPTPWLNGMT